MFVVTYSFGIYTESFGIYTASVIFIYNKVVIVKETLLYLLPTKKVYKWLQKGLKQRLL